MRKNNIWGFVIVAVVLLAVGFGIYSKIPDMNRDTISSRGSSSVTTKADEVSVYINVETLADSADESNTKNSEISDKIMFDLYKLGISRDDIGTEQFSVYEEFYWIDDARESKGFKTRNVLKVKTSDFILTGKIVDVATQHGGNVNSVNFEISDDRQKELKKQVLEEAAEDAKDKAEALVKGADGKLGRIISISDSGYSYRPYPMYEVSMGAEVLEKAVATDIVAKDLEVRADVVVVFELK